MALPIERTVAPTGGGVEAENVGVLVAYPGVALERDHEGNSPADVYLDARSDASRRTIKTRLNQAARLMGYKDYSECPFETWTRDDTLKLHQKLLAAIKSDRYVPGVARSIRGAVIAVLGEAFQQGIIKDYNVYYRAISLPPIKGSRQRGETLTATEQDFARTIVACLLNGDPLGIRDAALVALSSVAGLRSEEYANLDLADVNLTERKLRVRDGKGSKDRIVRFSATVVGYLEDYLKIRGNGPGAFFVRLTVKGLWAKAGTTPTLTPMCAQAIQMVFAKRSEAAGRRLPSHAFRRGASTRTVNLTDGPTAMKLLGHSNIAVTMGHYYDPSQDELIQAAGKVHVPLAGYRHAETAESEVDDEPPAPPVEARLAAVLAAMIERTQAVAD